jgi:hypothetical protein
MSPRTRPREAEARRVRAETVLVPAEGAVSIRAPGTCQRPFRAKFAFLSTWKKGWKFNEISLRHNYRAVRANVLGSQPF